MLSPASAVPPDLSARVFRALFVGFELRTVGGTRVAVPKGTPWYSGPRLAALARQISSSPPCTAPPLPDRRRECAHDRPARPC
jgi:hypothetical protein